MFNEKIVSESIGDKIYELIKEQIIKGKFSPGERLKEEELSANLNVSRTPLREAIKRLEIEGWVNKISRGGVSVSEISKREVKELYAIREVLEGLMIKEALEYMTDDTINNLEGILDKMQRAATIDDYQLIVEYGEKFHQVIYNTSQNQRCKEILENVIDHIARYRYIGVLSSPNRGVNAVEEHRKILEAIKVGDSTHSENVMREHIRQGSKAVFSSFDHFTFKTE